MGRVALILVVVMQLAFDGWVLWHLHVRPRRPQFDPTKPFEVVDNDPVSWGAIPESQVALPEHWSSQMSAAGDVFRTESTTGRIEIFIPAERIWIPMGNPPKAK